MGISEKLRTVIDTANHLCVGLIKKYEHHFTNQMNESVNYCVYAK